MVNFSFLRYNYNMKNLSGKGYSISTKIGRAIADYNLIDDKDRIIVAVSGGKDSLTMLKLLMERKKWAPVSYDILAVHIITDYHCKGCIHKKTLEKIFKDWGCEYRFINVSVRNKENKDKVSCFWCSWNRRKALFKLASEIGYNKIALGHHKDDVVETILMNLFFNGEVSAINANQPLFKGKISIIRPLVLSEEKDIRIFAKESKFPIQICRCPNQDTSKRTLMKRLITSFEKEAISVKSNIFKAPSRIKSSYLNKTACK